MEVINTELKSEDILTFYDYDQQAVLLAQDLEPILGKVYSESCAFYLAFIDENYLRKVCSKYERDILTNSGRKGHIVPVVLDDIAAQGVVGLSSLIGRIDLRQQWTELRATGVVTPESLNVIRNRCVLPMLEKLSDQFNQI